MQRLTASGALRSAPGVWLGLALVLSVFPPSLAHSQVFTVTKEKIDGHFLDFHPTNVPLSSEPLTTKSRQAILRALDAEHGFAMRPLPLGHHGLTLRANGNMQPGGQSYATELATKGISCKPGDRVQISDIKFHGNSIDFEINGGPDFRHRFLRHLSIGTDPYYTTPVVQDDAFEPSGSRITLVFPGYIPDMKPDQVKDLLAPLIGFKVESPLHAYTDTLPPSLRKTILEHHVLVGMSTDMVIYALGQPREKVREMDGQMPFEEWIYGKPPQDVTFVRINGNRVIRVEYARTGQTLVVHVENEMGDYWSTQPDPKERIVALGDRNATPSDEQDKAPAAPPTLRNPGEKLPQDSDKNRPSMQPVQLPRQPSTPSQP